MEKLREQLLVDLLLLWLLFGRRLSGREAGSCQFKTLQHYSNSASGGHQKIDHDTTSLRLGELLLEAVAWAGGLEGDLGEAGKQV